jgi:hypothetical protein
LRTPVGADSADVSRQAAMALRAGLLKPIPTGEDGRPRNRVEGGGGRRERDLTKLSSFVSAPIMYILEVRGRRRSE